MQGVFESLSDDLGGLLVYQSDNYRIQPLSAFVPNVLVQAYGLQRGHIVEAIVKARASGSTSSGLILDIGHGPRAEYFE